MVLQSLSSPATSTPQQRIQDEQKQLTSIIKRNVDMVSSAAKAAGLPIVHKLTVNDMLQLEKLVHLPNNVVRLLRSYFNVHHIPIFPSEQRMRQQMAETAQELEAVTTPIRVDGEKVDVTHVRVADAGVVVRNHLQQLSDTGQLVKYHNMPADVLFIETQADKGTSQ
jgi:hypothetical protein